MSPRCPRAGPRCPGKCLQIRDFCGGAGHLPARGAYSVALLLLVDEAGWPSRPSVGNVEAAVTVTSGDARWVASMLESDASRQGPLLSG